MRTIFFYMRTIHAHIYFLFITRADLGALEYWTSFGALKVKCVLGASMSAT